MKAIVFSVLLLAVTSSCFAQNDEYGNYDDEWYNDELGKLYPNLEDDKNDENKPNVEINDYYDYNPDYVDVAGEKSPEKVLTSQEENVEKKEQQEDDSKTIDIVNDYIFEDNRSDVKELTEDERPEQIDIPKDNFDETQEVVENSVEEEKEPLLENANDDTAEDNNEQINIEESDTFANENEDKISIEETEPLMENDDTEENLDLSVALDDNDKDLDEIENERYIEDAENTENKSKEDIFGKDDESIVENTDLKENIDSPEVVNEMQENFNEAEILENENEDEIILEKTSFENKDSEENLDLSKALEETQENLDEKENSNQTSENVESVEDTDDTILLLNPEKVAGDENEDDNSEVRENSERLDADMDVSEENESNEKNNSNQENEESVAKVFADLNSDLDKLAETWSKLAENEDDVKETDIGEEIKTDETDEEKDIEDKSDYENIEDTDVFKLFQKDDPQENDYEDYEEKNNKENESLLFEISLKSEVKPEIPEPVEENHINEAAKLKSIEQLSSNEEPKELADASKKLEPIQYLEDALVADDTKTTQEPKTTINLEDLTSSEIDELNNKFAREHKKELDLLDEDFDNGVAPIHIQLSVDEATEVTSPNYPSNYPTDNTVDWIFDGEGQGIELNITEFAINSLLGDYLLVKPGGEDASGTEGLVFAYDLTSSRRYRFFDVDKMFVRFHANRGMAFKKGFVFSVKMITPKRSASMVESPEAEYSIPEPTSTYTVALGGMSLYDFLQIKEQFRDLVASMATLYVNENQLGALVNTTSETTQITKVDVCNIDWPNVENCSLVTFGVPLVFQDEDETEPRLNEMDLETMWTTYVTQDPFSSRLRRLGLVEFSSPEDAGILLVWLIIGAGVLISIAMLAMALWRFNCFKDYTRMPVYSDTDSVHEKRDADLFPTPHQHLPAMFTDADYKWAYGKGNETKVDVDGFANKSYVTDDLYQFESDEEVTVNRHGYSRTLGGTDV